MTYCLCRQCLDAPTYAPTVPPTMSPTDAPSYSPSETPSSAPSESPTQYSTIKYLFDSYIEVVYGLKNISTNVIVYLVIID